MFMLPTVFSVPNSYQPDISLSSSWSLSEECDLTHPEHQMLPSTSSSSTPVNNGYGNSNVNNSNVNMSLAGADRERNYK